MKKTLREEGEGEETNPERKATSLALEMKQWEEVFTGIYLDGRHLAQLPSQIIWNKYREFGEIIINMVQDEGISNLYEGFEVFGSFPNHMWE